LQKKRHIRSIQNAVELDLLWVVATAKKRQENKLKDTNNGDKLGRKTAVFHSALLLSGADKIPFCNLNRDFSDPAIPDFGRLF
jgi:hypothetical protein